MLQPPIVPTSDQKSLEGGLYLHIPYCKKACNYCNFHFSTRLKSKPDLIQALLKELEMRNKELEQVALTTIYLGGGTPSLLSMQELKSIFSAIKKHYNTDNIIEYTLEANPDDLTEAYFEGLKTTSINRLSIGIQSFSEADLTFMGRAHNTAQAHSALALAQKYGYHNLSIDFIYGTPGLTDEQWLANLEWLRHYNIKHFSAYALTVEERTVLHHQINSHELAPIDPEQAARQFELLTQFAANNGYDHYEISNFAADGLYALHNTNYWKAKPYLGIGPGAHSFDGTTRRWNLANNSLYIAGIANPKEAWYDQELLTPTQAINEYIMTSIRTMWGCNIATVTDQLSEEQAAQWTKEIAALKHKAWIHEDNGTLYLTLAGKLYADGVASQLFL